MPFAIPIAEMGPPRLEFEAERGGVRLFLNGVELRGVQEYHLEQSLETIPLAKLRVELLVVVGAEGGKG